MRRSRDFVKIFNGFVEALNDGTFDVSKWRRMRSAWKELDVKLLFIGYIVHLKAGVDL